MLSLDDAPISVLQPSVVAALRSRNCVAVTMAEERGSVALFSDPLPNLVPQFWFSDTARGWKRRGKPETSFFPGVPETGVGQDVPVQVPVLVGLSKVQFRWRIQGPRTMPGERLLPGCSSRGWVRGRGIPGVVLVGRGLTLVLGSCGPILLGCHEVLLNGTAHGSASVCSQPPLPSGTSTSTSCRDDEEPSCEMAFSYRSGTIRDRHYRVLLVRTASCIYWTSSLCI
ncbi:hypothetical protein MTO96_005155 [Rhipicephalus appendiculatus]